MAQEMNQPKEGPYSVRRNWSNGCEVCPTIVAADGEWVANVVGAPHLGFEGALPTAALLAASWELRRELAYLVRLLEPIERNGSLALATGQVPGMGALNGARAALAKADGKDVANG